MKKNLTVVAAACAFMLAGLATAMARAEEPKTPAESPKSAEPAPYLYAVCFSDKKNGWVVGESGLIFKTTNGGESWNKEASPVKDTLLGLQLSKDGKVIVAVGDKGAILRTTPGAKTEKWEKVASPVQGTLRAVYFADNQTVFAVGDQATILTSKDAGKTWKPTALTAAAGKGVLRGIHFIDADHGWVCGDSDPDAPIISVVGVRTWTHIVTLGKPQNAGFLLITSDGGKNWKRIWVRTNFDLRSVWVMSEKLGFLFINTGRLQHMDGHLVAVVLDDKGGARFSPVFIPPYPQIDLNGGYFVSATEGWAVGGGDDLFRNDGGHRGGGVIESDPITDKPILHTPAPEVLTGHLRNRPRIIHTVDGGHTWAGVDVPADADINNIYQLRNVWFVDKDFGCAVGDNGCILLTKDGGKTWALHRIGHNR